MNQETMNTFSYRIAQASRTELVVIMLDMAKQYVSDGMDAFAAQDIEAFRENMKNAKRVTDELARDLDMQYSISAELMQLYMYLGRTLNQASLKKTDSGLGAACSVLTKLRSTFYEVAQADDSGPLMQNTQKVYAGLTYSNGRLNEIAYDLQGSSRGFTV